MKNLFLALTLCLVASPSYAQEMQPCDWVVPATKDEVRTLEQQALQEHLRVSELQDKTEAELDTLSKAVGSLQAFKHRIEELERKMAGVQKQVTVLHGKKADK